MLAKVGLVRRILSLARIAEIAPPRPTGSALDSPIADGSLHLRHVDAGSCNGCEIEISGCFSPIYDAERYGIKLTASPRHADGLVVTGVVTYNMLTPLRKSYAATPMPKVVIALGDCAINCGELRGGYGVAGKVSDFLEVDAEIPGCPPEPEEIIKVLREISRR